MTFPVSGLHLQRHLTPCGVGALPTDLGSVSSARCLKSTRHKRRAWCTVSLPGQTPWSWPCPSPEPTFLLKDSLAQFANGATRTRLWLLTRSLISNRLVARQHPSWLHGSKDISRIRHARQNEGHARCSSATVTSVVSVWMAALGSMTGGGGDAVLWPR